MLYSDKDFFDLFALVPNTSFIISNYDCRNKKHKKSTYLNVRTFYLNFFCLTALTDANFLISSVLSRAFATSLSMERMARFVSIL